MDKRSFIKSAGIIGLGGFFNLENIRKMVENVSGVTASELAADEKFWNEIRAGYRLNLVL